MNLIATFLQTTTAYLYGETDDPSQTTSPQKSEVHQSPVVALMRNWAYGQLAAPESLHPRTEAEAQILMEKEGFRSRTELFTWLIKTRIDQLSATTNIGERKAFLSNVLRVFELDTDADIQDLVGSGVIVIDENGEPCPDANISFRKIIDNAYTSKWLHLKGEDMKTKKDASPPGLESVFEEHQLSFLAEEGILKLDNETGRYVTTDSRPLSESVEISIIPKKPMRPHD